MLRVCLSVLTVGCSMIAFAQMLDDIDTMSLSLVLAVPLLFTSVLHEWRVRVLAAPGLLLLTANALLRLLQLRHQHKLHVHSHACTVFGYAPNTDAEVCGRVDVLYTAVLLCQILVWPVLAYATVRTWLTLAETHSQVLAVAKHTDLIISWITDILITGLLVVCALLARTAPDLATAGLACTLLFSSFVRGGRLMVLAVPAYLYMAINFLLEAVSIEQAARKSPNHNSGKCKTFGSDPAKALGTCHAVDTVFMVMVSVFAANLVFIALHRAVTWRSHVT